MECIRCGKEAGEYLTGDFMGYNIDSSSYVSGGYRYTTRKLNPNSLKPIAFGVCLNCLRKGPRKYLIIYIICAFVFLSATIPPLIFAFDAAGFIFCLLIYAGMLWGVLWARNILKHADRCYMDKPAEIQAGIICRCRTGNEGIEGAVSKKFGVRYFVPVSLFVRLLAEGKGKDLLFSPKAPID
jgi:hypothetical protein